MKRLHRLSLAAVALVLAGGVACSTRHSEEAAPESTATRGTPATPATPAKQAAPDEAGAPTVIIADRLQPSSDARTLGLFSEESHGTARRRELSAGSQVSANFNYDPAMGTVSQGDLWRVKNGDPSKPLQWATTEGTYPADRYTRVAEAPFRLASAEPLSTFSIDVDTASYANVRRFLREGALPPTDAVRIEELVNYFDYDYAMPKGDDAFATSVEVAECPWETNHRLVRVGIKARPVAEAARPASNLVFLLDVSGSMNPADRLPLVKKGLMELTETIRPQDRVSIVVYAGAAGLVLEPTSDRAAIREALDRLNAGGSTNGGAGIQLAYETARAHFIPGGINRVILATDGDFNVGTSGTGPLVDIVAEHARKGVFLTVLGVGRGNLNDGMIEEITNRGNGVYNYLDSALEARRVLVEQAGSTLQTVAKDVKIQVEFNPARVAAYRLVGYDNRVMANQDFADDTKDAGDIGAGHTVTAFYEVVPRGIELPGLDEAALRYQQPDRLTAEALGDELLHLRLRYKRPDSDTSTLQEIAVGDSGRTLMDASDDFLFAATVASFGMWLKGSPHAGLLEAPALEELAASLADGDKGPRAEFVELVRTARALRDQQQATP